ncbi:GGDEF domain-containing protein [Trinickia dinghuensis]|uniref:GGDEF domain-containing protein n=1 Tax=Trinickia dinghuensis TaxID=2291023 RepID=A0A3D8JXZ5_9BURK|nr:GGDEF domain-containing protein [Trinickia dinghuensis]RDU97495.1 GGDEF domain-containing protein [Trinickia dinghuensis]
MPARLFRSARNDRNRFVVLYVVLVLGLLSAAAAFVYEARIIIQDGVFEDRAFTVLGTTNRALDDLQDAETGQRGYLLTGSAAYLQPYLRGTRDVEQAMRQLLAGDVFLRRLAKWLSAAVRREDVLARVGGDEFVVLLTDYGDDEQLRALSRRLIEQVRAVAQAEYAGRFEIGLSIGIATFPDRVKNVRQLIDVADAAMYVAKREQSSFRFGPVTANDSAYGISVSK